MSVAAVATASHRVTTREGTTAVAAVFVSAAVVLVSAAVVLVSVAALVVGSDEGAGGTTCMDIATNIDRAEARNIFKTLKTIPVI